MMERWDKLSIIKKISIIIISIFLLINFTIGFKFGIDIEQNRLKSLCSSVLEVEKHDIESVEITEEEVFINLTSFNDSVSTKDRSIYNSFNPKHILKLKDSFLEKDITIR